MSGFLFVQNIKIYIGMRERWMDQSGQRCLTVTGKLWRVG